MRALRSDNAFVRDLPADPDPDPRRRQVHGALFSLVRPTPVAAPRVIAWSREMAATLGISEADIASPEFAQVFGGNALLEGMEPYAANYGGDEFCHSAREIGGWRARTRVGIVLKAGGRAGAAAEGGRAAPHARRRPRRA